MSYQHAKVITRTESDDQATIQIDNYNETLMTTTIRIEKRINSSDLTLLTDFIHCLRVITDHTSKELDVNVKRCNNGDIRIVKTWTEQRE